MLQRKARSPPTPPQIPCQAVTTNWCLLCMVSWKHVGDTKWLESLVDRTTSKQQAPAAQV